MRPKPLLPDFMVVGTAKAGTTSLYHYLAEHPEIYIPTKETFFFISSAFENVTGGKDKANDDPAQRKEDQIVTSFDRYVSIYRKAGKAGAVGEVGTGYLYYYDEAVAKIKRYLGDPRIIIMLRDPVDRAYSGYLHFRKNFKEPLTFKEAIAEEKNRMQKKWDFMWYYTDLGLYYRQVEAYLKNFSRVKICLFGDLEKKCLQVVEDLYEFIGVDRAYRPEVTKRFNISGIPKDNLINAFFYKENILRRGVNFFADLILPRETKREIVTRIKEKNLGPKPAIEKEMRDYLKTFYREDILRLQDLIKRDLSCWLE